VQARTTFGFSKLKYDDVVVVEEEKKEKKEKNMKN
jgi:hypothetical protein